MMERVMIVGGPGSGKSTMARALGAVTGLPVHHMDHIHYQPGWQPRAPEVKDRMTREIHAQPRWIFEGGHSRTYDERAARAQMLIWLDLPVGLRFWRVLRRTWRYLGASRPDMQQGCTERLDRETLKFWRWIWQTRKTGRQRIAQLVAEARPELIVVHLRSSKAAQTWLSQIKHDALEPRD